MSVTSPDGRLKGYRLLPSRDVIDVCAHVKQMLGDVLLPTSMQLTGPGGVVMVWRCASSSMMVMVPPVLVRSGKPGPGTM
jgi:hypothetical protein